MNSVEDGNWQEGWLDSGTSNREQSEEHAEGWWNEKHVDGWWKDEQTGSSSSAGWWTANDQTHWEPEGPVGAIEVNSVEPRYIKHDRCGQAWLMLNYDSGVAVTALLVAVARDLPLEKQGEFRVASGAVIPDLGKMKMKSTDENGVARSIRRHITEVAKPLLSAAEVSRKLGLSSLRGWRNLFWNGIPLLPWRSEELSKITEFGIVMARTSDFIGKATSTMRTCEVAMSRRS